MKENLEIPFSGYEYIHVVIEFYSNQMIEDKKFIITEKDVNTRFDKLSFYLKKWGNIDLPDFILLLNFINKHSLPKYISQNNLFKKKLNTIDFTASVHLNFFNPETVKNKYTGLEINYNIFNSRFGKVIIASISDYICFVYFIETDEQALNILKNYFKKAHFIKKSKNIHLEALEKINNPENDSPIQVLVNASSLQENVWKQLALLPYKNIYNYGEIALQINNANANRAVGTAIGKNPIAVLIPCHRVIQSSGKIGEFMWGTNRKKALLIYEILSLKK